MDKFFERHKLPKLIQKEMWNLNSTTVDPGTKWVWDANPLGSWKSPCDLQLVLRVRGSNISLFLYPWMQPTMIPWSCRIYCWKTLTYQWAHMVLFKGHLYFQFKKCVLTGRKHFWRKKKITDDHWLSEMAEIITLWLCYIIIVVGNFTKYL